MPEHDAALIAQLLSATHRMTRMATRLATRVHGPTHFRTLGLLRQFGPARIGEIAAHERISQPGATKLVSVLEAAGLVARERDPEDGRATVVSITPAGEAALRAWLDEIAAVLVPRFTDLSDDDRAAIARTTMLIEASLTQ